MINRVILTGRLTSDVELRKTNDGNSYTYFTIAVNRIGTEKTDFVPCVAWRQTAELMSQYLRKGALIGVEGKIEVYTKQENGNYDTRINVNVTQITFLESRTQAQERNAGSMGGNNNSQPMSFAQEPTFDQTQTTPNKNSFESSNESFGKTEEIDASNINIEDIKF